LEQGKRERLVAAINQQLEIISNNI